MDFVEDLFAELCKAQFAVESHAKKVKEVEAGLQAKIQALTAFALEKEIALAELTQEANSVIADWERRATNWDGLGETFAARSSQALHAQAQQTITSFLWEIESPTERRQFDTDGKGKDKLATALDAIQRALSLVKQSIGHPEVVKKQSPGDEDAVIPSVSDASDCDEVPGLTSLLQPYTELHEPPQPASVKQDNRNGIKMVRDLCDRLRRISEGNGMKAGIASATVAMVPQPVLTEAGQMVEVDMESGCTTPNTVVYENMPDEQMFSRKTTQFSRNVSAELARLTSNGRGARPRSGAKSGKDESQGPLSLTLPEFQSMKRDLESQGSLSSSPSTPRVRYRDREQDLERPKPITYDVGTMTSQNLPIRALLLSEAVDWRHLPLGAEMGYGWGLIPVLRDGYSSSEDENNRSPARRLGTDTFEVPSQLLRLDTHYQTEVPAPAPASNLAYYHSTLQGQTDLHPVISRPRRQRPLAPGTLAYNTPDEPVLGGLPLAQRARAMHYISPLAWPRTHERGCENPQKFALQPVPSEATTGAAPTKRIPNMAISAPCSSPTSPGPGHHIYRERDSRPQPLPDVSLLQLGLREGATVRVHSLKTAQQLNNLLGTCKVFDESSGRWYVKLSSGELKTLRIDHLQVVDQVSVPDVQPAKEKKPYTSLAMSAASRALQVTADPLKLQRVTSYASCESSCSASSSTCGPVRLRTKDDLTALEVDDVERLEEIGDSRIGFVPEGKEAVPSEVVENPAAVPPKKSRHGPPRKVGLLRGGMQIVTTKRPRNAKVEPSSDIGT